MEISQKDFDYALTIARSDTDWGETDYEKYLIEHFPLFWNVITKIAREIYDSLQEPAALQEMAYLRRALNFVFAAVFSATGFKIFLLSDKTFEREIRVFRIGSKSKADTIYKRIKETNKSWGNTFENFMDKVHTFHPLSRALIFVSAQMLLDGLDIYHKYWEHYGEDYFNGGHRSDGDFGSNFIGKPHTMAKNGETPEIMAERMAEAVAKAFYEGVSRRQSTKRAPTITAPISPSKPAEKISFEQIGGQTKAVGEIKKLVIALKKPELYRAWGTRSPRGIILNGPPGNGKTLLARALAAECGLPFYNIPFTHFMSKWFGESERIVDATFNEVRKTGGVLFIDEADAIVPSRGGNNVHEVDVRIVAAFNHNMDGFEPNDKVIVLFATNCLTHMDEATIRAGRVDRIIEVPLPDDGGRKEIFEIHIKQAIVRSGRPIFHNIDFNRLADKTPQFSGADIAEIIRRATESKVHRAFKGENPGPVTMEDLMYEIENYERIKSPRYDLASRPGVYA